MQGGGMGPPPHIPSISTEGPPPSFASFSNQQGGLYPPPPAILSISTPGGVQPPSPLFTSNLTPGGGSTVRLDFYRRSSLPHLRSASGGGNIPPFTSISMSGGGLYLRSPRFRRKEEGTLLTPSFISMSSKGGGLFPPPPPSPRFRH